ncbi:hypothetical protein ACFQS7_29670 [Dankookia sp. GCM10030260]|uniref:hypothetical protein n=1 Tax=Dankookia sp. GCM10030260 TaxID=3273390 RepID=UPI003607EE44
MLLYHYTAHECWPLIAKEGINRGEVALGPHDCLNAVWLTLDKSPDEHGLSDARLVTPDEARFLGVQWTDGLAWPNSRAVRLTVKVPRGDRALVSWNLWANKNVCPKWRMPYEEAGGGRAKAKTWFIYWGVVPSAWIVKKEDLVLLPQDNRPMTFVSPRR